jgi:hypothetical protein
MLVANILGYAAVAFTKISIIASYLRMFPYQTLRTIMYATAAIFISFLIATFVLTFCQCKPMASTWDFTITDGDCMSVVTLVNYNYANAAVNIASDLILCTAPLPYVWRMQLPIRQKALVSILFFIGGLYAKKKPYEIPSVSSHTDHLLSAFVASIVRLTVLWEVRDTIDITCESFRTILAMLPPSLHKSTHFPKAHSAVSSQSGGSPRLHNLRVHSRHLRRLDPAHQAAPQQTVAAG